MFALASRRAGLHDKRVVERFKKLILKTPNGSRITDVVNDADVDVCPRVLFMLLLRRVMLPGGRANEAKLTHKAATCTRSASVATHRQTQAETALFKLSFVLRVILPWPL